MNTAPETPRELAARIRTAGYWDIAIRPVAYQPNRVEDITLLPEIVRSNAVEWRGWDFPHWDTHVPPTILQHSVFQASTWQHAAEVWQLYQSGQFISLRAMTWDWRERSEWWPPDQTWKKGSSLGLLDALFTLTEIVEFASRLSRSEVGSEQLTIVVTVGGLKDRILYMDSDRRLPLRGATPAAIPQRTLKATATREELAGGVQEIAMTMARDLYQRFGRDFSQDEMRDLLKELRRR